MKLYVKQKVFSWVDRFYIKDEEGVDRYYVEGQLFSWGKKLRVYDMANQEIAFIQQKVFSFLPKFYVFKSDVQIAEIVKEFTFFKPRYSIVGLNWTIIGDFWSHEYQINENDQPIVRISKHWFTWGDSYELDILNDKDVDLALAVVLAIDAVMSAGRNAASHTSHQ